MAESGSVHRRKTNGHNVTAQLFSSFFLRLLISPFHHHTHTQASCCNRSRYSRKKSALAGETQCTWFCNPSRRKREEKVYSTSLGLSTCILPAWLENHARAGRGKPCQTSRPGRLLAPLAQVSSSAQDISNVQALYTKCSVTRKQRTYKLGCAQWNGAAEEPAGRLALHPRDDFWST